MTMMFCQSRDFSEVLNFSFCKCMNFLNNFSFSFFVLVFWGQFKQFRLCDGLSFFLCSSFEI